MGLHSLVYWWTNCTPQVLGHAPTDTVAYLQPPMTGAQPSKIQIIGGAGTLAPLLPMSMCILQCDKY